MGKICTNCGAQLDDSTLFCVNCGTPAPAEEPAPETTPETTPVTETPEAPNPEKKQASLKDLKKDPKKLALLAAAAVGIIAVLVIVISLVKPYIGWRGAITTYYNLMEGKSGAVTKVIPADTYEWIEDKTDVTKKDIKKNAKDISKDIKEETEDMFGKKVKATYKVVKSKKYTKQMLEDLADGIENSYDIDAKKVKKAFKVQIEFEVDGRDSFTWGEDMVTVVKIGAKWYVVESHSGEGKEARATLGGFNEIFSTETFEDLIEDAKK